MSYTEIIEDIFEFEKQYHLLDQKINGVYFWRLIRADVFSITLKHKLQHDQAHTIFGRKITERFYLALKMIYTTYLNSVFKRKKNVDILVFEHPRKVLVDNVYRDIYSHFFVQKLKELNLSYEVVDRRYEGRYYTPLDDCRTYYDHLFLSYVIKYILNIVILNRKDKDYLNSIEKKYKMKFGINLNLESKVKKAIKRFNLDYHMFKRGLKKRGIKQIVLVNSYASGLAGLIAAAHDIKIKVIELQHGIIDHYHVGYCFPNRSEVAYFPDMLLVFGKYWKNNPRLPLVSDKIIEYGFEYLDRCINQYVVNKKVPQSILFISQGPIGKKLSLLAFRFAKKYPMYKITYKLHPGEYSRWQTEYDVLVQAEKLTNFEIVDNNLKSIHFYFSINEFIVGVYSTALYEATYFEANIFLANIAGVESCLDLVENNMADLIDNEDQLKQKISNCTRNIGQDQNIYFKKISTEIRNKLLIDILNQ